MRIPVSEVIRKLTTVAENPGKAVKESCEKTGKRAVGFVAPYGPEEIAYAAGCLPVGLWGAQAGAHLSASLCLLDHAIRCGIGRLWRV